MLIIYGPTGVGKSDLALELASKIPAEIVNMDVGQLYTPLTIGTAKPDWQSESTKHHLFDLLDTPHNFTVFEYRARITYLINEIKQRGNLPILVGGSGFYLKSLLFSLPIIGDVKKDHEDIPINKDLWTTLYDIDPDRAQAIHPTDEYRIKRALDVWAQTGQKPSTYKPTYTPLQNSYHIIYVTRDRDDLYKRINARVKQMFDCGWIDEVDVLMNTEWIPFIEKKKLIGYNEIVDYIRIGKPSNQYQNLIQRIQTRTRAYARRQAIFWRMLEREIAENVPHNQCMTTTINLTSSDHSIYIKQLLNLKVLPQRK